MTMKKKFIICFFAGPSCGKTKSIREVYKLLTGKYPQKQGDFKETVKDKDTTIGLTDATIGISSWGDPGANEKPLDELVNEGCDIIVCASRTRGATIKAVEKHASRYEIIWLSPLHGREDEFPLLHDLYRRKNAEMVVSIIKEILQGSIR